MKFWLYMVTVILSLPKSIVFVVLGSPTAKNSKGAKWAKVVAIGVVVVITGNSLLALMILAPLIHLEVLASIWIRRKLAIATDEIEAERGISHGDEEQGDEELGMLRQPTNSNVTYDTSYRGAGIAVPYPYQDAAATSSHQHS